MSLNVETMISETRQSMKLRDSNMMMNVIERDDEVDRYPGDIFPSSFHIRPTHIPAIDSFPIESLHWKKVLLKKVQISRSDQPAHNLSAPGPWQGGYRSLQ